MTNKQKQLSGLSKQPALLKYPELHNFSTLKHLYKDRLCYIIKHYGTTGLSVIVKRTAKEVSAIFGDFAGNVIELDKPSKKTTLALEFAHTNLTKLIDLMGAIKFQQAQYYFTYNIDRFVLVDVQVSLNKLVGPGMVRDVFGKLFETQEIIKVEVINDRVIECLELKTGNYDCDTIIKPSKFSVFSHNTQEVPLYAECIKR